jgi:hypothetical protein
MGTEGGKLNWNGSYQNARYAAIAAYTLSETLIARMSRPLEEEPKLS